MRTSAFLAAIAAASLIGLFASPAKAVPFFAQSGNSFDPEIDIVESGALLDAQAVVSADRKYVTLTMRPQLSQLIALREFTFQNGFNPINPGLVGMPGVGINGAINGINRNNGGVRGNANAQAGAAAGAGLLARPAAAAARAGQPSVLERKGTTRIAPPAR